MLNTPRDGFNLSGGGSEARVMACDKIIFLEMNLYSYEIVFV